MRRFGGGVMLSERAAPLVAMAVGLQACLPPGRSRLVRALAWRALAAGAGIGLATALVSALTPAEEAPRLAALTLDPVQDEPQVRDVRLAPRPDMQGEGWVRLARAAPLFRLDAGPAGAGAGLEVRRRADATQRRDLFSAGAFAGQDRAFRLALVSGAVEPAASSGFVVAFARDLAAQGLSIQRSARQEAVQTGLGPVEIAEIGLSDGTVRRDCLGFRGGIEAAGLSFQGWWCAPAGRKAERQAVACLVDAVALAEPASGAPQSLRKALSREGRAASGCAGRAGPRQASWLDPKAPPPLRAAR